MKSIRLVVLILIFALAACEKKPNAVLTPEQQAEYARRMNSGSSALKPIDQAALQTMVNTTGQELLIPGAVVLLRTPQGEFTVTYGTTLLRAAIPPHADTHFRIASIFHDGVDFPGRRAPRMMKSVVAEVLDCRAYVGASIVVVVP